MSIIVAFLLASASATPEQPVDPAPTAVPTPAKPVKEKKICKTEDSDPGSHMVKRTCKTAAEWQRDGVAGSGGSGISVSNGNMQGH